MRFSRIKNLQPRPAIGGYIKIGHTVSGTGARGAYTRPAKFDHFEITSTAVISEGGAENFEPDVELMHHVIDTFEDRGQLDLLDLCGGACPRAKALGFARGLPRRLPIVLPSDDLEMVFPSRYAWYRGRTVFCEGDGEEAVRMTETPGPDNRPVFQDPTPWPHPCGDACPDMQQGRCKPHATLRVVAPFQQRVGTLYQFSTTSRNSFRSILGGIEWIRGLVGTVAWLPLMLEMTERSVVTRDGKATKAWIVALFYPGSAQELLRAGALEVGAVAAGQHHMQQLLGSIEDLPDETEEQKRVRLAEFGVDTIDVTPTPEPAPEPTPEPAPEPTPEPAPEPTPEPAPAERKRKTKQPVISVSGLREKLAAADHPMTHDTVISWKWAKLRAADEWVDEELRRLEAEEANLTYEPRVPRPSFVPEYGEPAERERLEQELAAQRQPESQPGPGELPTQPVPAPQTGSGEEISVEVAPEAQPLPEEQEQALRDLGWDGQGEEPKLNTGQRAEVVRLLKGIKLTVPADCLEWISRAVGREVIRTSDLLVSDLLTLRQLVADVRAEMEGGLEY